MILYWESFCGKSNWHKNTKELFIVSKSKELFAYIIKELTPEY